MANIEGIVLIVERYQRKYLLRKEPPLTSVNVLLAPIMVNEMYRHAAGDLLTAPFHIEAYVDAFLQGRKQQEN